MPISTIGGFCPFCFLRASATLCAPSCRTAGMGALSINGGGLATGSPRRPTICQNTDIRTAFPSWRNDKNNEKPMILNCRILVSLFSAIAACAPVSAQVQHGKASYYSRRATGSRTSSGERLHHDSLTCAHRTHPFGTLLRVTNERNGKEVVVRVTDRGPHSRGRIIDLSHAAAEQLGILTQGVAMVRVEPVNNGIVPYRPEPEGLPEMDFEVTEYTLPESGLFHHSTQTKTRKNYVKLVDDDDDDEADDKALKNDNGSTAKKGSRAIVKKKSAVRRKKSSSRRKKSHKRSRRRR